MSEVIEVPSEQRKTLHERGICAIIPTYNNVATISDVVNRTLQQCQDVIVVSDGCTDGTLEKLQAIKGITLIAYSKNEGKGVALKRGFKKALEMGFAYGITLDADGQHYPEDIPILLKANQQHPGQLIIGQRKLKGTEQSSSSKFANRFSNFWFWIQTGCFLHDTQTGYRLYPLKKLRGLNFLTSRYEAELELMVFASWHGVKLISTPVNVYYPPKAERVSHFRPIQDFARISVLNTVLCVLAIVYGLPLRLWRMLMTLLRSAYSLIVFLIFSLLIMTPTAMLYIAICKDKDKKRYGLHCILHFMAKVVMQYHKIPGVKFSIANPYQEDYKKPALIICNHQSHLDLMTLLVQTRKIIILTNDWVWHSPFYGYVIRNAEYYPVSQGIDNIIPRLKELVEKGYSIAVYPEGTRSPDSRIGRFHQGAFHIAKELSLDILPLVLYGAGKVLPKTEHKMHKGVIRIEIDKRITPKELTEKGTNIREITSNMRKYYIRRYAEMCNKIEQDV